MNNSSHFVKLEGIGEIPVIFLYAFNVIDILLCLTAVITSLLLFKVVYQTPLFHRNLLIFASGLFFAAVFAALFQMVMAVSGFFYYSVLAFDGIFIKTGPMYIIEWLRVAFCDIFLADFSILIFERTMATILLKSYEKRTNDRILIVAIFFAIIYGICISTSAIKGELLEIMLFMKLKKYFLEILSVYIIVIV